MMLAACFDALREEAASCSSAATTKAFDRQSPHSRRCAVRPRRSRRRPWTHGARDASGGRDCAFAARRLAPHAGHRDRWCSADWVSYPGPVLADRLDEGTSLMLSTLPNLRAVARVLDYVAAAVSLPRDAGAASGAQIDLLDVDSVALLAASENVAGATTILGTSLKATGTTRYDAILSNPRCTRASRRSLGAGAADAQAPKHLRPGASCRWWCSAACRSVKVWNLCSQNTASSPRMAAFACGAHWRGRHSSRHEQSETERVKGGPLAASLVERPRCC